MQRSEISEFYKYKIVVLGDTGVGKTSLIVRHNKGTFPESFVSYLGNDYYLATHANGIKLEIWDQAQRERFSTISSSYNYHGAHAFVIAFDQINRESFERVRSYWMKNVNKHVTENIPVVLVATKSDLVEYVESCWQRFKLFQPALTQGSALGLPKDLTKMIQRKFCEFSLDELRSIEVVSDEDAKTLASELSQEYGKEITYFGSTSAKNNVNVSALFDHTIKMINTKKIFGTGMSSNTHLEAQQGKNYTKQQQKYYDKYVNILSEHSDVHDLHKLKAALDHYTGNDSVLNRLGTGGRMLTWK